MKDYVTLDIGTYTTKLLYGHYSNGYVIVTKAGIMRTPDGLINNGLLNVDIATNAILELLDDMQLKGVLSGVAVVESTAIVSRSFTLPYSGNTDLQNMVMLEVERLFSDVLQNYIIDYSCVNIITDEDGSKADVMVFALPTKVFQSFEDTFINTGLHTSKLDTSANSSSKAFRQRIFINDMASPIDKTISVIDIGHTLMNIQIIEKGILKFSRALKIGGEDITKAIVEDLFVEWDEAEYLKVNEADLNALVHTPLYNSVSHVIDDMSAEIQRVLRYYTNNANYGEVDSIYIYGGTSRLKNIAPYMSAAIGHPVTAIDTLNIINLKNELPLDCYPSDFLNVTGALMNV